MASQGCSFPILTSEELTSLNHYIRLMDELRIILKLGGGLIRGQKKVKAVYIILQSKCPQWFQAQWTGMFFGLWSPVFANALDLLCEGWNDTSLFIWKKSDSVEPIHHIYHLSEDSKINEALNWMTPQELLDFQSEVLAWTLLPACFSISWLLLLEIFNENPIKQLGRVVPNGLKSAIKTLRDEFSANNISKIDEYIKLEENIFDSSNAKNRLRIRLPVTLSKKQKDKFFSFCDKLHDQGIKVKRVGHENKASASIEKENIQKFYGYLNLFREIPDVSGKTIKIIDYYERLESFQELSNNCIERYLSQIPQSNYNDSRILKKIYNEYKNNFLDTLPKEIKDKTIEKIRFHIKILKKYKSLVIWRYNIIMRGLETLALSSSDKQNNIYITFHEDISIHNAHEKITSLDFEFSEDYFSDFIRKAERVGYDMGIINHIHHFFQPGNICKSVYFNKEKTLQKGGPIIVSHRHKVGYPNI